MQCVLLNGVWLAAEPTHTHRHTHTESSALFVSVAILGNQLSEMTNAVVWAI